MKIAALLALIAFALSPASLARDKKKDASFGRYIGRVAAEWKGPRNMILLEDFAYLDPASVEWQAAKGSSVDGASIPQFAWSFVGGPFEGAYREASVIHDVACVQKVRPWKDVHRTFYTAMRASGVDELQAKVMYAAVYHFGPRWTIAKEEPCSPGEFSGRQSCYSTRRAGGGDPNVEGSYVHFSPSVDKPDYDQSGFRTLVHDIAQSRYENSRVSDYESYGVRIRILKVVGIRVPRDGPDPDDPGADLDRPVVTLEEIESFEVSQ